MADEPALTTRTLRFEDEDVKTFARRIPTDDRLTTLAETRYPIRTRRPRWGSVHRPLAGVE